MIPSPETIACLMAAALIAGCIDAMAGGGGLIAMPALLAAGIPPVAAVATNKLQSPLGTFGACVAYARAAHIDLKAYRWQSAERRVGKDCDSTCRSRWSPSH